MCLLVDMAKVEVVRAIVLIALKHIVAKSFALTSLSVYDCHMHAKSVSMIV